MSRAIHLIKYAARGIDVAVRRILFQGTNNERQLTKLSLNIRKIEDLITTQGLEMSDERFIATISKVNGALKELEAFGARAQSMQKVRSDLYGLECSACCLRVELKGALERAARDGDPSAHFRLYELALVEYDYDAARTHLEAAAGGNYVPALLDLEKYHRSGSRWLGILYDPTKAYELLKRVEAHQTPEQRRSPAIRSGASLFDGFA